MGFLSKRNKTPYGPYAYRNLIASEIRYVLGEGNYARFFLANGKVVMLSKTLRLVDERWPDLLRISKSVVINPDYILRHVEVAGKKEQDMLVMQDEKTFFVSRRKKELVRIYLKNQNLPCLQ